MDIWNADTWITIGEVTGVVVAAYVAILWIALVLWTLRDVQFRTSDRLTQALCMLLVALFFLPGLLLYIVLRPQETTSERFNRQLEAEAFLYDLQKQPVCPECRQPLKDEFIVCPYCRAVLKVECDTCGEYLALGWSACAYCGETRKAPVTELHPASRASGDGTLPRPYVLRADDGKRSPATQPQA